MDESMIKLRGFRKLYGDFVAVDGISFEVKRGEIFGLLGPNGAGKTSTLETLEGLRASDGGSLEVMGLNPTRESRKLRNLIGVQLQTSGLRSLDSYHPGADDHLAYDSCSCDYHHHSIPVLWCTVTR